MIQQGSLFRFNSEEWRLFGNVLNEVLNGFEVPNFERRIGGTEAELDQLLTHLHNLRPEDNLTLGVSQAKAVRNALDETIRELGVEEFHTRTGYEFERGRAMLAELDALLNQQQEH